MPFVFNGLPVLSANCSGECSTSAKSGAGNSYRLGMVSFEMASQRRFFMRQKFIRPTSALLMMPPGGHRSGRLAEAIGGIHMIGLRTWKECPTGDPRKYALCAGSPEKALKLSRDPG
jgi:hypothetical protein